MVGAKALHNITKTIFKAADKLVCGFFNKFKLSKSVS